MATEKSFENRIKTFLYQERCWLIKYWGGGEYTKAGVPDILCCCKGSFLGIEVKSKSGRPSPLQIKNLRDINRSGGYAILLYPQDFTHFKNLIEHIKYGSDEERDLLYHYFESIWSSWLSKYQREGLLM